MTPKEIREAKSKISKEYAYRLAKITEATRKAIARHEKQMVTLQTMCKHKHRYPYSGTPYESGGEMCDDCGKDLQ